jgi:amyloid beta precursor protein binding protein 1
MKAQSKVYVQLQNIYKTKARKDAAEVLEIVRKAPNGQGIDSAEVELFCKNAAFVKLINATGGLDGGVESNDRLRKVASTYCSLCLCSGTKGDLILILVIVEEFAKDETAEEMMMPTSLLPIYLALQATSYHKSVTKEDIMATITKGVPEAAHSDRVMTSVQELLRAQGGELHNISALTGGMVAQEMIKVITKQYIPIDNTCIFDGISSRCQVLRL